MEAKSRGLLARCVDGRLDRSVLSDVGVVAGVALCARGLFQVSSAVAWIFIGIAVIAVSIIAVMPPKASSSLWKGDQ